MNRSGAGYPKRPYGDEKVLQSLQHLLTTASVRVPLELATESKVEMWEIADLFLVPSSQEGQLDL